MQNDIQTPDQIFGQLFHDVQIARIFSDSKTFADCIPKRTPAEILRLYTIKKQQPAFSLYEFVLNHFEVPAQRASDLRYNVNEKIETHIENNWSVLSRGRDLNEAGSSLIPLPYPYVVPGGRFQEIYYWDAYFIQLGLAATDRVDLIEDMVRNFAFLIDHLGHIPSGNRTYFVSRSQPPFFAFMIELLVSLKGDQLYHTYISQLEKEYRFWMSGRDQMHPGQSSHRRVVRLESGEFLNRYFDDSTAPRQESYLEDIHLAGLSIRNREGLFQDLRAACESGWAFSSRWCADPDDLTTIRTTEIIPVDLNICLLQLEKTLQKAYLQSGRSEDAGNMGREIDNRKKFILTYCWDDDLGYFFDYDFVHASRTNSIHAGGMFPLFASMVCEEIGERCRHFVCQHLLDKGGILTTTLHTSQQWDAPNGWAPLQWVVYRGLLNYGFDRDASSLAERWIAINEHTYRRTGKLMEKYNVNDPDVEALGGDYPVQEGYGWTNGVLVAMLKQQVIVGDQTKR